MKENLPSNHAFSLALYTHLLCPRDPRIIETEVNKIVGKQDIHWQGCYICIGMSLPLLLFLYIFLIWAKAESGNRGAAEVKYYGLTTFLAHLYFLRTEVGESQGGGVCSLLSVLTAMIC